MRVQVTKIFRFEAAHKLPFHPGKCVRMHGHNYKLEVTVSGEILVEGSEAGMVIDFGSLKQLIDDLIVRQCDHQCLNDLAQFEFAINPTAENMILEFANILNKQITTSSRMITRRNSLRLERLKLWETDDCYAEWCRI